MIVARVAGLLGASVLRLQDPTSPPSELTEAAAPSPVELRWTAPEECPPAEEIRRRVQTLAGRPLLPGAVAHVEANAVVQREEARYVLQLDITTASGAGRRTLEGPRCEVVADAAALVIAAALEEPEVEPEPPSEPSQLEPVVESRCPDAPQPACPAEPNHPPEPPPSLLGGSVRLGARGFLGVVPAAAVGPSLAVALRRKRLRLEVGFDYAFPRRAELGADRGAAAISVWTLSGRACWTPSTSIVEFPLCGGVRAGPVRAEGELLDVPTTSRLPWVGIDAGAAIVVLPWSFLGLWLGADAVVSATRPGFFVQDGGELHRTAAVVGTALLGVEARFGAR